MLAFGSVAPFVRTKDERVQTRTDKLFNKALKILAGVIDTELNVYLNHIATAWYRRCPPMYSPYLAEDTKKARPGLPVAMSRVRRHRHPRMTTMPRRAPWRPSLRMSPKEGARNEARSAQLFLPLSEIASYIAGVLYSRVAISHLS